VVVVDQCTQCNGGDIGEQGDHHYRRIKLCRLLNDLPSIFFGHSAKKTFVECQIKNTRQKETLDKEASLPSVFFTLGKEVICQVFFSLGKDKFQSTF
jgi:hypothetical protein